MRVYLPGGVFGECWGDLLVVADDVFSGEVVWARYVLVDVGLEGLIKRFGRLDYPRFWLDWYFGVVRGLMGFKPGRVWAVVPDYPHIWSGRKVDHYFLHHWRIFMQLWRELDERFMPVVRFEGLGVWELGLMLDVLRPYLRDFEVLGIPSRKSVGPDGLWLAKVSKVRKAFPNHWLHGLGAGFGRVMILRPGLLDSIDFRRTFTDVGVLRSMAEAHLGIEGVDWWGPKNSAPRIHDYKGLRKALLEVLISILEDRGVGVDCVWR